MLATTEWDDRSWLDDQFSEFAEWYSGFESRCQVLQQDCHCSISDTDKNFTALKKVTEHNSEWAWLEKRVHQAIPNVLANGEMFHNLAFRLENPTEDEDGSGQIEATRNYDNYKMLVHFSKLIKVYKKLVNRSCGGGRRFTHLPAKSCLQAKSKLETVMAGVSEIYSDTPLLAMKPVQRAVLVDIKRQSSIKNRGSNLKYISLKSFKRRLRTSASKASLISQKKIKDYEKILKTKDQSKQKDILHSPQLLTELTPDLSLLDNNANPNSALQNCRIYQRILKEKGARVLKDFSLSVGETILPGSSLKLLRLLSGAEKGFARTKIFSTVAATEGSVLYKGYQDLKAAEKECQNIRQRTYANKSLSKAEIANQQSQPHFEDFRSCEHDLSVMRQMYVVSFLGGVAGSIPTIKSFAKIDDFTKKSKPLLTKENLKNLPSHLKESYLSMKFRMRSRGFKKENQIFDEINDNDNEYFIKNILNPDTMRDRVVVNWETAFLKHLNETTAQDKVFATALGNYGRKKFLNNLKKQLGEDLGGDPLKYRDHKGLILAINKGTNGDDVKQALATAYKETFDEMEQMLKADHPEFVELLAMRGKGPIGDARMQQLGGAGEKLDEIYLVSRYMRSLPPEQANKLLEFKDIKKFFSEKAKEIEKTRVKVQGALKGKPNDFRALEAKGDKYFLNSDAVQILKKSANVSDNRMSDRDFYKLIQKNFKEEMGLILSTEDVKILVDNHHAVDQFSLGFLAGKRTNMDIDSMSPYSRFKTHMTFDRVKAGAENESEISRSFIGHTDPGADKALELARDGIRAADDKLANWRASVQKTVFQALDREGKVRLLGKKFTTLSTQQQNSYLSGAENLNDVFRCSADDCQLVSAVQLTPSDIKKIGLALGKSEVAAVTRTTGGSVTPSIVQNTLRKISGQRLGKTAGQVAQENGEAREIISKNIVKRFHVRSGNSPKKLPYFEVHSNKQKPWERVEIVVYGDPPRKVKEAMQRAFRDSVFFGIRGPIIFVK